jgi:hypothetical protein
VLFSLKARNEQNELLKKKNLKIFRQKLFLMKNSRNEEKLISRNLKKQEKIKKIFEELQK